MTIIPVRSSSSSLIIACCISLWAAVSPAAVPAHDSADDPAYNNGWTYGSDGGSGWGRPPEINPPAGWRINTNTGFAFIGSSSLNGWNIDTNDRAFGMRLPAAAAGGPVSQVSAIRSFQGNLVPGNSISLDMKIGRLVSEADQGWALEGEFAGGGTQLGFSFVAYNDPAFNHGKPDYFVSDKTASYDTGVPVTDQAVHCQFTVLDVRSDNTTVDYALAVTPLIPGAATATFTGSVFGPLNEIVLADVNSNAPSPADMTDQYLYYNSINITVPEPSPPVALAALTGIAFLRRTRFTPS